MLALSKDLFSSLLSGLEWKCLSKDETGVLNFFEKWPVAIITLKALFCSSPWVKPRFTINGLGIAKRLRVYQALRSPLPLV